MNVVYVWKTMQRWCCRIVGIQCASPASMIGIITFHLHLFSSFNKNYCASYLLLMIFNVTDYRNARSQSCPFCRGSLKRVSSTDLWVLTRNSDVIDAVTLAKENLRRFYLYVENIPVIMPATHVVVYDYMLWLEDEEWSCKPNIRLNTPLYIYSII